MNCLVCESGKSIFYKTIADVKYFECCVCFSLFADPEFIYELKSKDTHYNDGYWENETIASRERSFGSSMNRVFEVFFYARIPIKRFIDIGTGPGYLLDSLSVILPEHRGLFYGCEVFPPPPLYRTRNENYKICSVSQLNGKFSAGVCIEVIEHLPPDTLKELIRQLAAVAEDQAVFYFNSAQPSFVKNIDPNYLDPHVRGHIVSYSPKALNEIFATHGFTLIPLPGRDWCFLAEFKSEKKLLDADGLLTRLWTARPENVEVLKNNGFGPLAHAIGLESARCYLEHAISEERTAWAQSLL